MTRAQLVDVLLQTRELVERDWTQGAYCRLPRGEALPLSSKMHLQPERQIAYCVAGALDVVGVKNDLTLEQIEHVRRVLEREIDPRVKGPDDGFRLERWNDAHDRVVDDVVELIDAAIARTGYVRGVALHAA